MCAQRFGPRPATVWLSSWVAVLTLSALPLGCQPPPATPPESGAAPPPESAAAAPTNDDAPVVELAEGSAKPSNPDALDPEVARTETSRILKEVAAARNLAITSPVKVDVMSKKAIRDFAQTAMYEDTTPEELQLLGRIEASFGKLPVGSDPEQIYLDLLEEGVLGLYDPKRKTLFIGDFVSKGMLSMVVGHEIAHGLQDMHFDLKHHQEPMRHRSDEETARRFLIEGGAQAAYLAWVSGEDGLAAIEDRVLMAAGNQALDLAELASPHPILARSLQMPYTDGTATVAKLVKEQGWSAIDKLYADLPDTSEQMLHLDKLLADEPARPAKIDEAGIAAVLPGMKMVWHDQVGEADLLAMIAQVEKSVVARRACAGWGGDHFVVFDDPKKPLPAPVVVGVIAWDTVEDAKEAETSFARYLRNVTPGKTFVERKGDTFVFGLSIPQDVASDDVRKAAWRSVSVGKSGKSKKGKG